MSTVLITQEMLKNINFDTHTSTSNKSTSCAADTTTGQPSVLIVFGNSDINAAIYHLIKSLENPFDTNAIATVLVQESIKDDFIKKVQQQLKPYNGDLIKTNTQFVKALQTLNKLNAQVVTVEKPEENLFYPSLVCDFTHEQFGINPSSGIVTLHTFRTAKEAAALVNKESLNFIYTSIWHENYSYAYELVAAIKSQFYFINCYQVPMLALEKSIAERTNYVTVDKSYHYETLQYEGVQKSIVFPIGSIFAN